MSAFMNVYADNAATTKLSDTALRAMLPYLRDEYGNPSSLHCAGRTAAAALTRARETIAECVGCKPSEIYFTSCGSESDTQALLSAAEKGLRDGKTHIVSTSFEHHAVLGTLARLADKHYPHFGKAFDVTLLDVGHDGYVSAQQVRDAVRSDTCLVTVMHANNEVGTIQPIREIGSVCREKGVTFHTDAVQSAGHIPIDTEKDNIDMMSLSAHKFHGPKGAGILYARKGVYLSKLIEGGSQERGMRGGTQNTAAIVGAAAALKEQCENMENNRQKVTYLRDKLIDGLTRIPDTCINGGTAHRLPSNVNITFDGVEGEALLLALDAHGICASSGSACAAGSGEPSHVLLAMGRTHSQAASTLRFTLSESNTEEDVEYIIAETAAAVRKLRVMRKQRGVCAALYKSKSEWNLQ